MKIRLALALLLFTCAIAGAQIQNAVLPDNLKAAGAILTPLYPKIELKKSPKAPADAVYLFRAATAAAGTVEVGFEKDEVVYMVFRRGTGGVGWKLEQIAQVHDVYHKNLLKEAYNPVYPSFTKYNHSIASAISGAVITRKNFDPKVLNSAF
jgi:hypothetical protein